MQHKEKSLEEQNLRVFAWKVKDHCYHISSLKAGEMKMHKPVRDDLMRYLQSNIQNEEVKVG